MSTYRTGNHWGVTIVREYPPHPDRLVAVVTTGDVRLAERICRLLNGETCKPRKDAPCPTCSGPSRETVGLVCQTCGTDYGPREDTP